MFFSVCDGIFLNYNWNDEKLAESLKVASDRSTDVYVGVDVFGRGCLGGGGFCTDLAVAEARKFGLSVAIFAPGWVHERLEVKDFEQNQFKFWDALQKFCPARKLMGPVYSSFCPGLGKKMFRNGKVISNVPWCNVGLQSLQPIYSCIEGSVQLYAKDAYNGGGCVCLCGDSLVFKTFETDISFERDVYINYTYKPLSPGSEICLLLGLNDGAEIKLSDKNIIASTEKYSIVFHPAKNETILPADKNTESAQENVPWVTRSFTLKVNKGSSIHSISVLLSSLAPYPSFASALLGELEITPTQPNYNFTYRNLACKWSASAGECHSTVRCLLEWKYTSPVLCSDLYVEIEGEGKEYVGTTSQISFNLERVLPCVDSFNVILCPKSAGCEDMPSSTLCVNVM